MLNIPVSENIFRNKCSKTLWSLKCVCVVWDPFAYSKYLKTTIALHAGDWAFKMTSNQFEMFNGPNYLPLELIHWLFLYMCLCIPYRYPCTASVYFSEWKLIESMIFRTEVRMQLFLQRSLTILIIAYKVNFRQICSSYAIYPIKSFRLRFNGLHRILWKQSKHNISRQCYRD